MAVFDEPGGYVPYQHCRGFVIVYWVKTSEIRNKGPMLVPFRNQHKPIMDIGVSVALLHRASRHRHAKFERHIQTGQLFVAFPATPRQIMDGVFCWQRATLSCGHSATPPRSLFPERSAVSKPQHTMV